MISVRNATAGDLDALLPLVQAYRVFYEQEPDERRERKYIQSQLPAATSVLFVAEESQRLCGFTQLFQTYSTVYLAKAFILEDLYVDPAYRKKGVAARLLQHAEQFAHDAGAAGMFLETAYTNQKAQRVYERAGWTRENRFYKYNAPARQSQL